MCRFILLACFWSAVSTNAQESSFSVREVDSLVFIKVNNFRINKGRKPLEWYVSFFLPSKEHADHLCLTKTFYHRKNVAGECLYEASSTKGDLCPDEGNYEKIAQSIFLGWKHSPPHAKLMLNRNLKQAAAAVSFLHYTEKVNYKGVQYELPACRLVAVLEFGR